MRVAIPHSLPREEARRRLRERSGEIANYIPGGMADVSHEWESDDRMALSIGAMGHSLRGHVEIEDHQMVFEVDLPPALGFIEPIVAQSMRKEGEKLLAPPARD